MQVSLDRHYCGGNLVEVKISVTGKHASCGMEESESTCPGNPVIDKKCCENQLSFYSFKSTYYPEYLKLTHPVQEKNILPLIVDIHITGNSFLTSKVNWVLPPGEKLTSGLTQSEICVFRI